MDDSGQQKTPDDNHSDDEDIDVEDVEDESESEASDEEEATETEDNGVDDDDEDDGSDTELEESDDEIENQAVNGAMSPQSDGAAERKCYICLNPFTGQDIGSPESCADVHYFCLECIEEWSKVCPLLWSVIHHSTHLFLTQQINTCPVDRNIFTYIAVRREIGSAIIMKVYFDRFNGHSPHH